MAAFYRSIDQCGVKYKRYIGDGDCATFKGLLNLNPYDVHVQKLQCYLYVKKRMGARCRNLKKQTIGLGGSSKNTVKLTDKVIKKLQKYYGLSITRHHDNTPSQTCSKVTDYLTQNGVATIPQLPCSPDLAPADFFLFPKMKSSLKGHHHGTPSAVKEASTRTLKDLPVSAYQGAFEL